MKHEPSLSLILILVINFSEAAPRSLFQAPERTQGIILIARSVFQISSQTDRQIHKRPIMACAQILVQMGGGPEQRF